MPLVPIEKQLSVKPGDIVKVKTSRGIAKSKGWVTPVVEGRVVRQTDKAILVDGYSSVYDDDSCMICGLTLKKFTSRFVHIGPICAANNNLYYPSDTELSEEQRQEIRNRIKSTWSGQAWLPRAYSQVSLVEAANTSAMNADQEAGKVEVNMQATKPENKPEPVVDVRITLEEVNTPKYKGEYIVVRSLFMHKERCTSISYMDGRVGWCAELKAWLYHPNAKVAKRLSGVFEGLTRRGNAAFKTLLESAEVEDKKIDASAAVKAADASTLDDVPDLKYQAWNHQKTAYHAVRKLWGFE